MLRADMHCEPLPQPEGNVLVLHEDYYPGGGQQFPLHKPPAGAEVRLNSYIETDVLARVVVEKIANSAELSSALAEAIAESLATVLVERGVLLIATGGDAPGTKATDAILKNGMKALLGRLELREMATERRETPDE
jgi:hypothetical protein